MKLASLLPRPRHLATRLVAPFVLLAVFLAVVGTWYATRQAVGSLQERRLAQLADALRREQVVLDETVASNLAVMRRVAASPAVVDATAAGDPAAATAAVSAAVAGEPAPAGSHVSIVTAAPAGASPAVVVDVDAASGAAADAATVNARGAQFASFAGLRDVISVSPGAADDKDAALVPATDALAPALVVAGPLRIADAAGTESVVGAVVVATPLSEVVETSRAQLGLDTAIATSGAAVLASTFGGDGGPFAGVGASGSEANDGRRLASSVDWSGGDYTVATAPLTLRGADAGLVAAALPDAPVAKTVGATRAQVLVLFAGGLVGVLLVGFWISRRLSRDLGELASAAGAVAAGDFDRRVPQRSRDELGRLAHGFNEMAARLGDYRAEQEDALQALREADRAKDEFIDNLSHELRTPLTPIKGSARLLARDDLDAETRRQMATMISANSDRLLEQVNRLIAMSTRAQRGEPRREAVDVAGLLVDVVEARVAADLRGRVRIVAAPEGLPPAHVDATAVSQVLYDLLDNALKFSDDDVSVNFGYGRDWIAVEIGDRGPGIPDGERERVFERFYQVDGSSTRAHGGLGLGLTVAADLARWLGGSVDLGARTGGGTNAVLRLPRAAPGPDVTAAGGDERCLFGLAVQGVPAQPR